MSGTSTVALLDAQPELASFLTGEERALAARLVVPVLTVEVGEVDLHALLTEAGAFAAIVLNRILLYRLRIREQSALALVGPGDMVALTGSPRSALLSDGGYRATGPTHLALLDDRVLMAARRFPRLVAGLHARTAEQHERLTTHMAICQLARVEDRVLAMLWLLAESWGRVTASGTTLPLTLTHDTLGELIGAKRPTVTLALTELGATRRRGAAGPWVAAAGAGRRDPLLGPTGCD